MLRASSDIAEAFNSHITRIGEDLANTIPNSDIDPLTYVKQTNSSFSFREITIYEVLTLLRKIATNKATGLDKIPSKLLKIGGQSWKKASVPSFQAWLQVYLSTIYYQFRSLHRRTGRGGCSPPPNFGQLRLSGQREKIWAKSVFWIHDHRLPSGAANPSRGFHLSTYRGQADQRLELDISCSSHFSSIHTIQLIAKHLPIDFCQFFCNYVMHGGS